MGITPNSKPNEQKAAVAEHLAVTKDQNSFTHPLLCPLTIQLFAFYF